MGHHSLCDIQCWITFEIYIRIMKFDNLDERLNRFIELVKWFFVLWCEICCHLCIYHIPKDAHYADLSIGKNIFKFECAIRELLPKMCHFFWIFGKISDSGLLYKASIADPWPYRTLEDHNFWTDHLLNSFYILYLSSHRAEQE